jgi:hypothetical protein
MIKELVTIEFRYLDISNDKDCTIPKSKTITVGIYDTFEEAIIEGNKALEIFEKHFKLNPNWNVKERFGKTNGCFRLATRLVSPLAYLECPFDFYAKITTCCFDDIEQTILGVLEANKRYKEFEIQKKKKRLL